jgi:hypothetical protein
MVSEYYFIRERKEFMDLLKTTPTDFESYLRNRQTQNYMVGFLRGKKMYDKKFVDENDLLEVIAAIEKLDIKVGIFEQYNDSLAYFSKNLALKLPKEMAIKRITLKRPTLNELSEETKNLILETNYLDQKLYEYCLERFKRETEGISGDFRFTGDKYDHVIAYAARACFYEFCLNNKKFIQNNFDFFKDLTFHLLQGEKITDGRIFAKSWNDTFLKHFEAKFSSTGLNTALQSDELSDEDPVEYASNIGSTIDKYLKANPHERYQGLKLDYSLIQIAQFEKKSVIRRLFGRN